MLFLTTFASFVSIATIFGTMKAEEIQKALRHLKKDGTLARVIAANPKPDFSERKNPYHSLVRTVIYQQLSGKAAGTIRQRFLDLYPHTKHPKPEEVLKTSDHKLRATGISRQKIAYIKDVSQKFADGSISARKLRTMTDDDVRSHLLQIKGIGNWTVDMFLMFNLSRPDVLSTGDLGIQKGFQRLFKLKALPDPKTMTKLAEPWRPYRTIASWYLWRIVDTEPDNPDW